MAPPRAYVPSATLLRALSHPLPPRCPFVLRSTAIRTLRTETQGTVPSKKHLDLSSSLRKKLGLKPQEPPTDHDLGGAGTSRIESIEWYEQDSTGKQTLIDRVANKHDLEKVERLERMYEKAQKDPNYDTSELLKASIDSIAANPNFADLRDQLEDMKKFLLGTTVSKAEEKRLERDAVAEVRMEIHENLQQLIDDADMADVREDLIEVQRRVPEIDGLLADSPEWNAVLEKLGDKLANHEVYQRKHAAQAEEEAGLDPTTKPEEVDALMKEMQELLTAMGSDPQLEKQLIDLRNEDPMEALSALSEGEEHQAEIAFESLAKQLSQLKDAPTPEELEDANVSPELQAKVDKILEDPNLMEKLGLIKDLIQKAKSDVTLMSRSAPDPVTLDPSELTTLSKRLKFAESDPEHIAAMRRLRIDLVPPFNISPALRSLNEALKLAYVGANDDVRRILWRAYFKARSIPTLLQNIPDDAWDMLWYSQAVTWNSNQNRQDHLRILLKDLASVGKDGPPTHPQSLPAEDKVDVD